MRKALIIILSSLALTSTAGACPEWECQLGLDDYSCSGVHGSCLNSYSYSEISSYRQYIYCPYCGHETWDCICNTGYHESYNYNDYNGYDDYDDYYYDDYDDYSNGCSYQESYCYSGGSTMSHWANIRDCSGNIIGQVGCGSSVEIYGTDPNNPDRVMIYDYESGTYGSVLSECVYGGYTWDGTGDNGYYNQYNGECTNGNYINTSYSENDYNDYYDCSNFNSNYNNYSNYCSINYVRYTEALQIIRQWEMASGACRTCY